MLSHRKRLSYFLLVLAGVWVSHELAYLLAHPDPLLRAAALGGHAYLQLARALVAPAAALAFGGLAIHKSREANLGSDLRPMRLAGWQTLVFLALEVVERIPHGTAHTVLAEPAIYVGLALMLPVAALLARLVVFTARVVAAILGSGHHQLPTALQHHWVPLLRDEPVVTTHTSSLGSRGPPDVAPVH